MTVQCVTLNDVEMPFYVEIFFSASVWLPLDSFAWFSETVTVPKENKDTALYMYIAYDQGQKCCLWTPSFWRYKTCIDICCRGSLQRRRIRQTTLKRSLRVIPERLFRRQRRENKRTLTEVKPRQTRSGKTHRALYRLLLGSRG